MTHMQLKKRFSVRKSVAAGAMAMAMFAISMPAMANGNGLGLNLGFRGRTAAETGVEADIRAELKSIKAEMKQVTKNDRASSETEARKQCRLKAREAHASRLEVARDERDAGLRKARTEYLSALKSARVTFRLAIGLRADGTGTATAVSGSAAFEAARKAYQESMRASHEKFSSVKRGVLAEYHADAKASKATLESAVGSCK